MARSLCLAALALVALLARAAHAHVSATPSEFTAGSSGLTSLKIGHGCALDDESYEPTLQVVLEVPGASPMDGRHPNHQQGLRARTPCERNRRRRHRAP